jgi:hypothetical protein
MFYKADGNSEIYSRKNETSVPLVCHALGSGIEDKCFSRGGA